MDSESKARILLYTGKGGVGKTSVAAATALRCAERGYRTVVMSTDIAHSLADSLGMPVGPEPEQVAERLWAQECDIYHNLERYWGTVQKWMQALLAWRGVNDVMAEEIAVLPGMDELANLLWVNRHVESGDFDVIVVDCAPTGETLRLLSFPEVGRWWMEKMVPIERQLTRIIRPIARRVTDMPLPEDEVFAAMSDLATELEQLNTLLTNPARSSSRLVVNPEKMAVREAQRSFTYLTLYGHVTDAVVVNRVVPESASGEFAAQIRAMQSPYVTQIHEVFDPIPVLTVPQFADEVVGLESLRCVGEHLHGDADPAAVLVSEKPYRIKQDECGFEFEIPAPFVTKAEASLVRRGDELVVRMGSARRNIVLPRALARMRHEAATLDDGRLRIRFTPPANEEFDSA